MQTVNWNQETMVSQSDFLLIHSHQPPYVDFVTITMSPDHNYYGHERALSLQHFFFSPRLLLKGLLLLCFLEIQSHAFKPKHSAEKAAVGLCYLWYRKDKKKRALMLSS